ncbi:MAG: ATP-binding protein [Hyphomicrobiaceae bacterium]
MEQELGDWLYELGLGEYAEAFAENHVDFALLTRLTTEDLKEIGVRSVGHRRKILDALAGHPSGSPPLPTVATPANRAVSTAGGAHSAERRQLTVLFCDLVGSTAMSQRLDPEVLSEVIRNYQNIVAGEVVRYEGHVAKFMGDGIMALFGYPQAHEDDCERAIRSAISLLQAIERLAPVRKELLRARIGISTGDVVVGDLVGEGAAQEEAVIGDTPNLAARLQEVASAGQIIIDSRTHRLVRKAFSWKNLGSLQLKGFEGEHAAWRVSGELQVANRFDITQSGRLTNFVGRQHELGLLLERWELAQRGEGQVVLLSGEAGIGKSRLLRAMLGELKNENPTRLSYQCSPYHTNSVLYPVLRQLERVAELDSHDSDDARCAKLEALFPTDDVPIIAGLFSSAPNENQSTRELHADERKERIQGILVEQLIRLAKERPVLFLLEDAHWIEPTTLEVLMQTAPNISEHGVLMVLTHRQDWHAPFSLAPNLTRLTLNPLSRMQTEELVRSLAGSTTDEATIQHIASRTDGVPLFVEELTKSIIEAADTKSEVPESLQASLLARLDRLGSARDVAQVASVVGRDFSQELLARATGKPGPELAAALEQLVASELVYVKGTIPVVRYTFKHALIQDTAYSTLLIKQRRYLHERIANALQELFPAVVETEPEILAHHYTEAGLNEMAANFWERAARRAAGQSANLEAVDHFRRAIELLSGLPESAERRRMELRLQLGLGPALMAVHGWGVREVAETYERARALGTTEGNIPSQFQATWGLWLYN